MERNKAAWSGSLCKAVSENETKLEQQHETMGDDNYGRARRELVRSCLQSCAGGAKDPFCSHLEEPLEQAVGYQIGTEALCPTGRARVAELRAGKDSYRPFPPTRLNVGVRAGVSQFKYVNADAVDQPLTKHSETRGEISAGSSFWHIFDSTAGPRWTFEALALWGRHYAASDSKARWCKTVGLAPGAAAGGTDTAQTCNEEPLGAPSRSHILRMAARVGVIERLAGWWRTAIGVDAQFPINGDAPVAVTTGPILVLSTASGPDSLKYKGLVLLGPVIQFQKDHDGSKSTKGLITLTLGGDALLFAQTFDQL
jgi:hypothetical protein